MSFFGKVVLVTGASSGIGAATAELFAKEGARVALVGRNQAKLGSVAQRCAAHGAPPLVLAADLADEQQASTIVDKTVNHFGQLDVLVNNSGIIKNAMISDPNILENFDTMMNMNLRVIVQLTNLAIPHLVASKGNVVNVSSVAAHCVLKESLMAYSVSKIGVEHFTRCAAFELAASGIRVNCVNPGPTRTDCLDSAVADQEWEEWRTKTALQRVAKPEEIADLIVFLASEKARSITGSAFVSDNGIRLKH